MTQPTADPWTSESPVHHARAGHDTATANGNIFVVGGFHAKNVLHFLEEHPMLDSSGWRDRMPMPTRRSNPAAAELGGLVYVTGGRNKADQPLNTVEVYDSNHNRWADGPALPKPRAQAAAASLDGVLYVAGGFVQDGAVEAPSDSVLALGPGGWTPLNEPMPTARVRLRLVAAGEYLYAIGGQNTDGFNVSTVERYHPPTETWTELASMNHDRGVPGVVAITRDPGPQARHFIVVVGGAHATGFDQPPDNFLDSTEIYDVQNNTWFDLNIQLPQPKAGLTAAELADGRVLAIAGTLLQDGDFTATKDVYATTLHL
jgi:N-acetylneuraminic acid mutarotase